MEYCTSCGEIIEGADENVPRDLADQPYHEFCWQISPANPENQRQRTPVTDW